MDFPLSAPTKEWFENRFPAPTPVQIGTWESAAAGNHLLAVAPTGSGKTLAAFLVALDRLYSGETDAGALKVLYVSPLKALGTDIKENLSGPLRELKSFHSKRAEGASPLEYQGPGRESDIRIGIRNGDTSASERRRQSIKPPEILVTTPESLNNLLLSDSGRKALSTVEVCIIDEIHAIAPGRRGTLLSCAMERLVDIAGEFQRIGLTATVQPLERAAAFLGGYRKPEPEEGSDPIPREVSIVAPPLKKDIRITIETLPSPPATGVPDPDNFWRDIARRIRERLESPGSTLAFVDSRKWSEKAARLINEGRDEPLAWAHHGSLSKDMRRLVERRLKDGSLRAVVATGSLELGIDVGALDEVLLLGTPAGPSTALQRAGRAGHRPDETSRARIFPIHSGDMLAAAVLADMAESGEIEELKIPENPLDILAQVLLALCSTRAYDEEELWNLVRRSWSYNSLPRASFDTVIAMLRGYYAGSRISALKPRLYKDEGRLVARPGTRMHLYAGGGAIPDLGMYAVRQQGTETVLGSLDEKFVWESQAGSVFHLGNRRWRIVGINDKDVTVIPTDEPENTEPFWRAEGMNRDPGYSRRIAELLESAEKLILRENDGTLKDKTDKKSPENPMRLPGQKPAETEGNKLELWLSDRWHLLPEQSAQLASYLRKQRRRSGTALPNRHHVVAEAAADPDSGEDEKSRSLFIHTFLGGRVNRPLALALQAAWAEQSPVPLVPTVTDDCIAFVLSESEIDKFVGMINIISNPEALIRGVLESTPYFGGLFREAAGRALLLPSSTPRRRQPLWMTRQRSRTLMEAVAAYTDFPIITEVWRSCLNDEFAMDSLEEFLEEVRNGDIKISIVRTPTPSPFAGTAVRRRLSRRMTSNMRDEGESRLVSRVEGQEIRRLSRAGALRPRIPEVLVRRLDTRRRRIGEGYAPGSIEAFKAWIAEREAFDERDWQETLEAVSGETGRSPADLAAATSESLQSVSLGPGRAAWKITSERAEEWLKAFDVSDGSMDAESAAGLIEFWISGRGPVSAESLLLRFGYPSDSPEASILMEALSSGERTLTLDRISEGEGEAEICDAEGMEILLRWRRRQSRNSDAPLPASHLAPFLATRQGLSGGKSSEEAVLAVMARLEGYPLPAGSWEASVLPSRLSPYQTRYLDNLVSREELIWVGAGTRRITWLTGDGGWRYPEPVFPGRDKSGRFPRAGESPRDFWSISEELGGDSASATKAIWEQVWTGHLTAGDAGVLRRAVGTGFKARPAVENHRRISGGLRGWTAGRPVNGRWYAPSYAEEPADPLASDQLMRERIRLLLNRYGILSRPLLEKEIPPWHWSALTRTLNLMELGEELIGGRWFEGLPMPQFLHPECLAAWREAAVPGRPWAIEAIDPASPCGVLENPSRETPMLPARREGTWLAWDADGRLSFVLSPGKKSLAIAGGSGNSESQGEALSLMAGILVEREVNPLKRIVLSQVNEKAISGRRMMGMLENAGFTPDGAGNWIRRPRPIGMR